MMKKYWNRFLHWHGWKKVFPFPAWADVLMLELSQAIFAIFSLQAGMLHTFGTGDAWEHWLNLAVGCLVCLLTVAMGIYMVRRANREMKQLQEKEHGK